MKYSKHTTPSLREHHHLTSRQRILAIKPSDIGIHVPASWSKEFLYN